MEVITVEKAIFELIVQQRLWTHHYFNKLVASFYSLQVKCNVLIMWRWRTLLLASRSVQSNGRDKKEQTGSILSVDWAMCRSLWEHKEAVNSTWVSGTARNGNDLTLRLLEDRRGRSISSLYTRASS